MALETILYSHEFAATDTIEIIHNLNRKDFLYVVVIDGVPRNDLITNVMSSVKNDNDKFSLFLSSPQDGYVLLIKNDYMALRTNVITFENNIGDSGTNTNIDWSQSMRQNITLTNNCILTFEQPDNAGIYILKIIQNEIGGNVITWPENIFWPYEGIPTLNSDANSISLISFYFDRDNFFFYNLSGNLVLI